MLLAIAASTAYFFILKMPLYAHVESAAQMSKLTVVLPTSLPADSKVVSGPEYDSKSKTIITSFEINGKELVISQQKRPGTSLDQIDAADTFLVEAGSVYVLKGEPGRLQAIIETPDSWIMVNSDARIGSKAFKAVLELLDTI